MTVLAQVAPLDPTAETVLFWVLAVVAVGSALAVVTLRHVVHAALMLVVNLLAIAGLYLVLQSSFLAVVQVIVYAGAIMVLFLFVIMLLGVDRDDLLVEIHRHHRIAAVLVGLVLAAGITAAVATTLGASARCIEPAAGDAVLRCVGMEGALEDHGGSSVAVVASRLFGRHTFAFEVVALVLTAATVGALVLGRRRDEPLDDDELDRAEILGEGR